MKRVVDVPIKNVNSTPDKIEEETTIKHNPNTDEKKELSINEAFQLTDIMKEQL